VASFDTAFHATIPAAAALEYRSGLTALAGTGDMREVEAAAERGEPDAIPATDVYTHRLVAGTASMCAATGGLDALGSTDGAAVHTMVITAREDLQIAGEARHLPG
jgi:acetate kinase